MEDPRDDGLRDVARHAAPAFRVASGSLVPGYRVDLVDATGEPSPAPRECTSMIMVNFSRRQLLVLRRPNA